MNPTQLLAHFERINDAPDAIPRLRRFILDLAVRGKLVSQDSKDEPALLLLQRIAAARAKLGLHDANKHAHDAGLPFALPAGWTWTTIGEICSKTGSGSTPRGGEKSTKKQASPSCDRRTSMTTDFGWKTSLALMKPRTRT